MKLTITHLIGPAFLGAFLVSLYCFSVPAKQMHHDSLKLKELKEDYAEIHHIKYGLFNLSLWKSELSGLLRDQVNKFELSDQARRDIRKYLVQYLEAFYRQQIQSGDLIDQFLGTSGDGKKEFEVLGFKVKVPIKDIIKKELDGALATMDVSRTINNIADQLMLELKRNEPAIRVALQEQLADMIGDDSGAQLLLNTVRLEKKYKCEDLSTCSSFMKSEIERYTHIEDTSKKRLANWALLTLFILVILVPFPKRFGLLTWVIVPSITLTSLSLLSLGLTLPMIDLYAGLDHVKFSFMDKEVLFGEQVMFYQSKSILEVVDILLDGRSWDSRAVGYLILVFSILFPIIKTVATFLLCYIKAFADRKMVQKIALTLSKWSMADVFVVGLFMAYIGFNSVIESQILDLGKTSESYEIITRNKTILRPGAIFFTGFVIASLCLSTILTWRRPFNNK